jgi:hypothetical protein
MWQQKNRVDNKRTKEDIKKRRALMKVYYDRRIIR